MRFVALIAALATLMPLASAQRGASAGHASAAGHASVPAHIGAPHSNLSRGNFAFGRNSRASASRRSSSYPYGYASLPFPFFGDSFDPDDIYSTGYPVASPPPPYLMQALSGLTGASANPMGEAMAPAAHQSTDPLMIELQNGRYVRINSAAANGDALPLASSPAQNAKPSSSRSAGTPSSRPNTTPPLSATVSPQPLPPAVLIFRDGHREEVRDYTIADGVLYARGDFYTDGYWNKKIDLSTLNLNQTLQANADRSVNFILPSAPNEVVTRP
ncbi:MAG: hypothetical protein WCA99_18530 [Candidatus Sulfotelmatobacter sp.]